MKKLSKLQEVERTLLYEFQQVCEQEGFTWYAVFGTLLGAARHGGFIPWDDDIDVAMPRADYDRLRRRPDLFEEPYFLQTPQNDPAAAPRFMRLRHSNTAFLSGFPNGLTRGGHMGIYIDILPLDDIPNARQAREQHAAVQSMQNQLLATAALDENAGGELPDWKAAFCYGTGGMAGCYALLAERYEWLCSRYAEEPFYVISVLGGARGARVLDKRWFAARETMEFEGLRVTIPSGWKELLVASYPDGLLEPEADDRKPTHQTVSTIIDTERSYREYTARYTDMLKGICGKKVLLFGAGDSLRIWLARYAAGLEVVCTFDNNEAYWGKTAYGLPVRPPRELSALFDENVRLIITSIWHNEISKQLDYMGIIGYYIFLDGLEYRE